ncbi:MAG: transglutaminase-like domain-containing protein [Planctomycetota bacterium]|jgi:hypothetical protein
MTTIKLGALCVAIAAILTPPSGRPPVGPLERHSPRVYDFRYAVTVTTSVADRARGTRGWSSVAMLPAPTFDLRDTPIVMPVIYQGAYHAIQADSVRMGAGRARRLDGGAAIKHRIDSGLPYHGHLAVFPIRRFNGSTLGWSVAYRMQSFSSRIDDLRAAEIAWPRDWPDEVVDGLDPQMYIESDDPGFADIVDRVSEGRLRMTTPYLAAKELVRHCVEHIRVSGDGLHRGPVGVLHGLDMQGARATAKSGRGGPHDLVCVCVAVLRAAGIPARPVIGVMKHEKRGYRVLVSWAEFYLPQAGWVPFDPVEMRGKSLINRDVREPWPEFGTMKDLNRRMPIAYHYMPPRAVESPIAPALWGWAPRPARPPIEEQRIVITTASRGRGVEDPR